MEHEVIKLELPCSPQYVGVARKVIEGIASRRALSSDQVEDLKLAVGEACSNAVKFSESGNSCIHVLYRMEPDRLEIEVRNTGRPFEPKEIKPAYKSIEQLAESGLGIYVMQQVTDELEINCDSGQISVRMVKLLNR